MKPKTSFLFLSLIFALYKIPPSHTQIVPLSVSSSIIPKQFIHDGLSNNNNCDEKKWQSQLIAMYNVSVVLTVDQNGCGNFSSVQKAVDSIPKDSPSRTLIIIDSGTYKERVEIYKQNVIIQGQGYLNTSIEWNNTANSTGGTFHSYSVGIFATNFVAYNISFKNTAPPPAPGEQGAQAVALRVGKDQAAFYGCGIYANQDTLHDDDGRHYYRECFIEGYDDFIFGEARSLYELCTINVNSKPSTGVTGAITAQGRNSSSEQTGFSFVGCNITGNGNELLGRAWRPYATVVFAKTFMTNVITFQGWDRWRDTSNTSFFGEYKSWGPGANMTARAAFAKNLNRTEAKPFLNIRYIDGKDWLINHPRILSDA